jgi:plastocyanin
MRAVVCITAIAFASSVAAAGPSGKVTGKVKVTEADGKPTSAEVIVYVVGFNEPPAADTQVTVKQKGRKFVPELVAVTLGGKVNFPNEDAFLHNVFSQSSSRKFDLGSFKKGETKTKEFPAPGVVDVYCNIHPEMAATILVLPNQRHTRVASDGTFSLDGVPPGSWTVFAYTRRAPKPVSTKVTVTAGAETKIELAIQRGAEPPHLNKYGEKYRSGTPNTYN